MAICSLHTTVPKRVQRNAGCKVEDEIDGASEYDNEHETQEHLSRPIKSQGPQVQQQDADFRESQATCIEEDRKP